jgi:selenide, water dikinase
LAQVLRQVMPSADPAVLVDASTADDAAVYRLDAHLALVVTADFFTPIVDDPFDFGRIAAANALSDIYAMGARPLLALNLVGFPRKLLGQGILEEIMRGGAEVTKSAGIPILGGHSIDDAEPKYGLCVVGVVAPDQVVRNSTPRPEDVLVLTKALGTGVVATAIKAGRADGDTVRAAVESMTTLNRAAAEAMRRHGVTACTDVTGYGLVGHLREMVTAAGVDAVIRAGTVPILPGARELVTQGHIPGGTRRNLDDAAAVVSWGDTDEATRLLLADAQTSGGLLVAVPAANAEAFLTELRDVVPAGARGTPPAPAVIGSMEAGAGRIRVA